jgi:hypothetical protein
VRALLETIVQRLQFCRIAEPPLERPLDQAIGEPRVLR